MRAAALIVLVVAAVACWPAAAAQAACPVKPADYTGTDAVVDELRELRREQADSCAELNLRLSSVVTQTTATSNALSSSTDMTSGTPTNVAGWVNRLSRDFRNVFATSYGGTGNAFDGPTVPGKLDTLHADVDQAEPKLDALHGDVDQAEPKLDAIHAALTTGGGVGDTVALSTADRDLLAGGFNATSGALWFLIGLMAVSVGAGYLLRAWLP